MFDKNKPKKFEYWVFNGVPNQERLNKIGADGWQMILFTQWMGELTFYFIREVV